MSKSGGSSRSGTDRTRPDSLSMSRVSLNREGLRQESFDYLSQQSRLDTVGTGRFPVTITHTRGQTDYSVTDGRHRIILMQQRGTRTTTARLRTIGPRGGETTKTIRLRLNR